MDRSELHMVVDDVSYSVRRQYTVIALQEALKIISAAEQKAQEMGLAMNMAVMDAGRNLVAFHRMDGA